MNQGFIKQLTGTQIQTKQAILGIHAASVQMPHKQNSCLSFPSFCVGVEVLKELGQFINKEPEGTNILKP